MNLKGSVIRIPEHFWWTNNQNFIDHVWSA